MARYEELTTPEAVLAAFEAGRRVQSQINGSWDDARYSDGNVRLMMKVGVNFRALIEKPEINTEDMSPGGTIDPESLPDDELPSMWWSSDTAADEVRGPPRASTRPTFDTWGTPMHDLHKLADEIKEWAEAESFPSDLSALDRWAETIKRALSAQGEAVAGCYVDDNLGVVLCKRGHEKGRRLYTHPAPRVEVDEATERAAFEAWYVANCSDMIGSPLGSMGCNRQWQSWMAARRLRPQVTEEMVERLARHLCREEYKDSGMPLDELISACNRYWPRYKDEARAALTAALNPENNS